MKYIINIKEEQMYIIEKYLDLHKKYKIKKEVFKLNYIFF